MGVRVKIAGRSVLFIGAHPDDIELGAGALVHQIAALCDVHCVTLSENRRNGELDRLVDEHRRSMAKLGISADRVRLEKFETRRFGERRQDLLDYFVTLRREWKPELVFVHSRLDVHQDHNVVTAEALRAFRGTTLLGFEVLRSSHGFFPNLLLEVSASDVGAKLAALAEYATYRDKSYFNPELVRAAMMRNGELAEREYAEGFEVLRAVGTMAGGVPGS